MTAVADGDLLHGCRRVGHVVVLGQRSERERKSTAGRHLFDCQRVPARRKDPVVPAEHETSRALEVGREVRGKWTGRATRVHQRHPLCGASGVAPLV